MDLHCIPKSGDYCYVTISHNSIYYNDENNIVCWTLTGEELFKYQHKLLEDPFGICLDVNSNVYVCGNYSQNVHQISSDGKKSRILLDTLQSISCPCCVILHPQRNELIVTSYNEDTVFEVYKLK